MNGLPRAERARRARVRAAGARRRAREVAAPRDGRELSLDQLYARDHGVCQVCFTPCPREQASKDHRIPLAKGGAMGEGNEQLAHKRCNSRKKDRVGPKRKGLRRKSFTRKVRPRHIELPEGVEPDDVF